MEPRGKSSGGLTPLRIATFNSPHRLGPHTEAFADLAKHVDIIAAQENADVDAKVNCPKGWKWFRPVAARSNALYWNPAKITFVSGGVKQMSDKRWIVWAVFDTHIGRKKIGSIHLPAFKTSSSARAAEFRRQEILASEWLEDADILAGDYNATIPSNWTPNLNRFNTHEGVSTGPGGIKIDYVVANGLSVDFIRTIKYNSDHKALIAEVS